LNSKEMARPGDLGGKEVQKIKGLGLTESCGLTAGTWPSLAALLDFVGCGASCKMQCFCYVCAGHTFYTQN
jgi:hypothetical protein